MGVDCKISLPQEARVHNVAEVIGILLGKKVTLVPHTADHPYTSAEVEGARVTVNPNIPTCVNIEVDNTEQGPRHFLYHMEWTNGTSKDKEHNIKHGRGLMPRSTAINIAMGIGLVKFFGGEVDFNDCDDIDCNFRRPKRRDITACDGKAWENFQKRIAKLKPLTYDEIWDCEQYASYKTEEEDNLEYRAKRTLYESKRKTK